MTALDLATDVQASAQPGEAGQIVLSVRGLHTEFGSVADPVRAVRGVSFDLHRGRLLVLLGESGSGKSVTARSILRLYGSKVRVGGEALFDGHDLFRATDREMERLRGNDLALVPQDPTGALDPLMRIGTQLTEVLRHHEMVQSKAEAVSRGEELLDLVGIPDPRRVARSYPHQLSGGMRQRAVIALAVACEPRVLFADEPTTALDVTVQAQILELFVTLQRSLDMAIILVTHDVGVADQIADDVAVMYAGRIVERGPAHEVLDHPVHPYTRALLASLPGPRVERGRLQAIPGRAVLAGEALAGCPFAARCRHATEVCDAVEPHLVAVGGLGREAACSRLEAVALELVP
jgi:oligopeptide/dipeptide ABC transporter ATP-binding protein